MDGTPLQKPFFASVPMLTFRIYWDQTPNSKQILEEWKEGEE